MADLAKDIEQLKQLKSDLERLPVLQEKVQKIKKEISEIQNRIKKRIEDKPEYGRTDAQGCLYPVTEAYDEIEREISRRVDDRVRKLYIILMIIAYIILAGLVAGGFLALWLFLEDIEEAILYLLDHSMEATIALLVCIAIFPLIPWLIRVAMADCRRYRKRLEKKYSNQIQQAKEADAKATQAQKLARQELPATIASAIQQDPTLIAYRNDLPELENALVALSRRIQDNNVISDKDKYIGLVNFVYSQLVDKRADSLKEALQRYDDKAERDSRALMMEWKQELELERQRQLDEERWEEQKRREARLDREREALRKQYESDSEKLRDAINELNRR